MSSQVYTHEDLKVLADLVYEDYPKSGFLFGLEGEFLHRVTDIDPKIISFLNGEYGFSSYGLQNYLFKEARRESMIGYIPYRQVYDIMYEVPLSRVPMYIKDPIVGTYAKWRLKIGK